MNLSNGKHPRDNRPPFHRQEKQPRQSKNMLMMMAESTKKQSKTKQKIYTIYLISTNT